MQSERARDKLKACRGMTDKKERRSYHGNTRNGEQSKEIERD